MLSPFPKLMSTCFRDRRTSFPLSDTGPWSGKWAALASNTIVFVILPIALSLPSDVKHLHQCSVNVMYDLRFFNFRRSGVQQPCLGVVGICDPEHGRLLQSIHLKAVGIPGSEGVS